MNTLDGLFWFLLLGHFTADYVLQTEWMVKRKAELRVLALHVSIHFLVMSALMAPSIGSLWLYLLALAGIHFFIDLGKIRLLARYPRWNVGLYLIDQMMHYLSIALIVLWVGSRQIAFQLPASPPLAIYLIGYLFATYVWYISERILSSSTPAYRQQVIEQAWPRMLVRAAVLSAILLFWRLASTGSSLAYLAPTAVVLLPYTVRGQSRKAILIDMGVPVAAAVFIIFTA